jgi:hypothetical protein
MIGLSDAPFTYEYEGYFKILPQINAWDTDTNRIKDGDRVQADFEYTSDNNKDWMTIKTLSKWLQDNKDYIGKV